MLTEGGMVEGSSQNTGLFRYVDVFKGIPFAAPPGRFQKPVRHPGWDGVYTSCFNIISIFLASLEAILFYSALMALLFLYRGSEGQ